MATVQVLSTDEFDEWLPRQAPQARSKVLARIKNMEGGNNGDCKPVGEGISESRIDYGPGYRLYFQQRGEALIILLAGGDKSTQEADIAKAKQIAAGID